MNILHTKDLPASIDEIASCSDFHVLTDAHVGFSVLHTFGTAFGIEQDTLKKFAQTVNAKNESGSLHPWAGLSAVPTTCTRKLEGNAPGFIVNCLQEFLQANESTIKAKNLIFDFQGFIPASTMEEAVRGHSSKVVENIYLVYPSASS